MLIHLAWKNIWRNKARSIIVAGSVAVGLWIGVFTLAYVFGMIDQRLKDAVENEVSHFQIHHPNFNNDFEPKYVIPNGSELLGVLSKDGRLQSVTARTVVFGMIASAQTSAGGKFIGVIPDLEDQVTGLQKKITEGSYFDVNSKNQVILSERLAKKLSVKLRSKVVLTFQDTTGSIVAGAFRICALYKTYNSGYDETNVFISIEDTWPLLGVSHQYHELAALLKDSEQLTHVKSEIATQYPLIKVDSWKEIAPELAIMIDSFDQYMVIFLIIILLALSFGIINTMLMAVLDRVREIGMLMAIGMNRWRIFMMISIETIYLVLLASPIGLILAYFSISYLGKVGMDLSALYQEGYAAFGFKSYIYPKLEPIYYWRILVMVAITAVLSALYPALTAIRLDPVNAIRKI